MLAFRWVRAGSNGSVRVRRYGVGAGPLPADGRATRKGQDRCHSALTGTRAAADGGADNAGVHEFGTGREARPGFGQKSV